MSARYDGLRICEVVLPNDVDDPRTPSGGNTYDRRVCAGLTALGWTVREHAVPGAWPTPTDADRRGLATRLDALPDGAVVLVDGLVGSGVPDVLVPRAGRLRFVVLVHMPLEDAAERAALAAARAVVATSAWSAGRIAHDRVTVAPPGVDPAPLAPGTPGGTNLLCVAAVTPLKGHDVLVAALSTLGGEWACTCVGSLDRDPAFAARVAAAAPADRFRLVGPRTGAALDAAYAAADLLVLPSRAETYGMVITEALARGIPVAASDVGGVREAMGSPVSGFLLPRDDPAALSGALRRWLDDPQLRSELREHAAARRATLTGWDATAARVAGALRAAE